jgi:hypothetical protein
MRSVWNRAGYKTRRAFTWTPKQIDRLNQVKGIIKELEDYKPLTLRQVYYRLVKALIIPNKKSQYVMLSKLIKHARLDGLVPWEDFEDRSRSFLDLTGWSSSDSFVSAHISHFCQGYQRDMMQNQKSYIEVWIEKDALSRIFSRVAEKYSVPVVVCRGFSSISFLNDFKNRIKYLDVQKVTMLYFGDFDPSGLEMFKAMIETIENELNLTGVLFKRVALMKSDIKKYNLPHDPDALNARDSRARKFVEKYGSYAVELDALHPKDLEGKIKRAIEKEIDIDLYRSELKTQNRERLKIETFRNKTQEFFKTM